MNEKIVQRYKEYFMEEVAPDHREWGYVHNQLDVMRAGIAALPNMRIRQIILSNGAPGIEYLESTIKASMFPILSMDDDGLQWIHDKAGSGTGCFGLPRDYSPGFVAARTLILLGSRAETKNPIRVLVPCRNTRVCLDAMSMLRQDIGGKMVEVTLPWQSLESRRKINKY